jgi:hypothetical protein
MREPLGIVYILIARCPTVNGLAQRVRQRRLRCSSLRVGQVLLDEFAESQTLAQLPHQNQSTVRRDSRSLEIDFQGAVERELSSSLG